MCSWEQMGEAEIPLLEKDYWYLLKEWNNKEKMSFKIFLGRKNDLKLSK